MEERKKIYFNCNLGIFYVILLSNNKENLLRNNNKKIEHVFVLSFLFLYCLQITESYSIHLVFMVFSAASYFFCFISVIK